MACLRAYALARLGRHDEARAANDHQAELAARLASPELASVADHDGGLIALLAGDHERAAELLGRALAGDPPVQRAEARLRRAEALARLGRADEADAEIRAATLEPIRAAHRPAVLVARMTFAQALSARASGDLALAERRLREAEGHWRRLAGDDDAGARAPRLARRPRAAAGHRASSTRRASSSAWPRSCEHWRPLPTFDDSATSDGAGRGGVEAPLRPGADGRVVGGRSSASSRAARARSRSTPTATPTSRCRRSCAPPPTAAA